MLGKGCSWHAARLSTSTSRAWRAPRDWRGARGLIHKFLAQSDLCNPPSLAHSHCKVSELHWWPAIQIQRCRAGILFRHTLYAHHTWNNWYSASSGSIKRIARINPEPSRKISPSFALFLDGIWMIFIQALCNYNTYTLKLPVFCKFSHLKKSSLPLKYKNVSRGWGG